MCILLSLGHKLGSRVAGAVSTHMLSFDIAKQRLHHFTLVSVCVITPVVAHQHLVFSVWGM